MKRKEKGTGVVVEQRMIECFHKPVADSESVQL